MEIEELYHLTNSTGIEYLKLIKDWKIIDVEGDFDNSGFLHPVVIIRGWSNEEKEYLGVIYISKKYSGGGAGFFSRFEYFCRIVGCRTANINPKYDYKGDIIWPSWYCTKEEFDVFIKKYNQLHEKYYKYIKSDCA